MTRCLGPAVKQLAGVHRSNWKGHIDALPEFCPHADCTAQAGCRAVVADYFRTQWHTQARREIVARRKPAGVARG